MFSPILFFIIVVLSAMTTVLRAQTQQDVKDLITQLFTTDGYNKKIRPVTDQSQPVQATMDLNLVGVLDFDEVAQKLTTIAWMEVYWLDELLTWSSGSYGGLSSLLLPQDDVWKPDLALQNGFTQLKQLGSSFLSVEVNEDGYVAWYPYEVLTSKCKVDILYFPFDQQRCELKFVAWSSSIAHINLQISNEGILLYEYEENGEWEIVSTSATSETTTYEATVKFSLVLQRKPLFYIMNVIMPVVLLSLLNLFVFVLPAESGEKLSFAITVFLAFAVFLTIVSSTLPQNSENVPLIAAYLIVQSIESTFIALATALQLRIYSWSDKPVPGCLRPMVSCTRVLCCRRSCRRKIKPEIDLGEEEIENERITWSDVCSSLDVILFVFFLALIGTSNLSIMIMASQRASV